MDGPHTAFVWPQKGFAFDIDERVDPDLFLACSQAWQFLDDTLNGLRFDRTDDAWPSRLLLIYFAARLYGATVAVAMLLAHRMGREAIIMGRSQYEYFIKMLYYDHRHDEARHIIEQLEVHDFKFFKKVGVNVTGHWSPEDIQRLQEASKRAADFNFKSGVDTLRSDETFLQLTGGDNPFAVWFFRNLESSYRTHWTYGSTIVHASPVDLSNVVVPTDDGNFIVNVDSRMKAPNKTIADASQRCFSAVGLLRWRFGLEFTDAHIRWAQTFGPITERHKDEQVDRHSMHD